MLNFNTPTQTLPYPSYFSFLELSPSSSVRPSVFTMGPFSASKLLTSFSLMGLWVSTRSRAHLYEALGNSTPHVPPLWAHHD